MKLKYFLLLFVIPFISCKKKDVEIFILNNGISMKDTLRIKLKNNTDKNQLLFLKNERLDYSEAENSLNVKITRNGEPVKSSLILIDDFIFPDDDTDLHEIDSIIMMKKDSCSKNFIKLVPPNNYIILNFMSLDYNNRCESGLLPDIEKGSSYKIKITINADSTFMKKEEMKKINLIRRNKKVKLFQGQIESNAVVLKT